MTSRASAAAVGTGSAYTGIKRQFRSGRGTADFQGGRRLMDLGYALLTFS